MFASIFKLVARFIVVVLAVEICRSRRGEDCRRGNNISWSNWNLEKQRRSVGQIASTSHIFLSLPLFPPYSFAAQSIPSFRNNCCISSPNNNIKWPSLCLGVVFAQAAGDFSSLHPLQILSLLLLKHRCFQEGWDEFPLKQAPLPLKEGQLRWHGRQDEPFISQLPSLPGCLSRPQQQRLFVFGARLQPTKLWSFLPGSVSPTVPVSSSQINLMGSRCPL